MADRVYPLKLESPGYGTEFDATPTELDPSEDHLDVRGVFLQNDTSDDETVLWTRDSSSRMTFIDSENTTPLTLTDLGTGGTGISETTHRTIRQLIHFIDEGPAGGFASGAYREQLPSGSIFPTSVIWWESSSKLKKIVERTLTWTGVNVTTSVWEIYDTDGSSVLATVSDSISYTGVVETNRTRTITVS